MYQATKWLSAALLALLTSLPGDREVPDYSAFIKVFSAGIEAEFRSNVPEQDIRQVPRTVFNDQHSIDAQLDSVISEYLESSPELPDYQQALSYKIRLSGVYAVDVNRLYDHLSTSDLRFILAEDAADKEYLIETYYPGFWKHLRLFHDSSLVKFNGIPPGSSPEPVESSREQPPAYRSQLPGLSVNTHH